MPVTSTRGIHRDPRARRNFGQLLCHMGLLIAAVAPASAVAADELEVYGKINVTLQNSDEAAEEQAELKSNSSRIGVKGELALNAGLKAIYQLEWGVNLDSESDDDNITPRNQFVGLEGAFGKIKVGRHDTALKEATQRVISVEPARPTAMSRSASNTTSENNNLSA